MMNGIGTALLLAAGYLLGDRMVKNMRRYVVSSRKGDDHANGMVMTYVFTGIIISLAVMILISWIFGCSQLWFFPTFAAAFLINMRQQYREEKGSMNMPAVNQEFLDHFQADMAKYAKEREEKSKH